MTPLLAYTRVVQYIATFLVTEVVHCGLVVVYAAFFANVGFLSGFYRHRFPKCRQTHRFAAGAEFLVVFSLLKLTTVWLLYQEFLTFVPLLNENLFETLYSIEPRAGLTHLDRVCTVLVGPSQFFSPVKTEDLF